MAVINKSSFSLTNVPKKRGPLVRVELQPGRFVKMYQEDAIAAGYIKEKPAAENKMRLPAEDKRKAELPAEVELEQGPPAPADFTTISGVGPATARLLTTRGITTFEQLRQAGTLDYVSVQAMQAIERWRQSGDTG